MAFQVTRGTYSTTAAIHISPVAVYFLQKKTFVMGFARQFFGSPSSGSYAYPVFLPDARIGTAELFMTNSIGNSDVTRQSFTSTVETGIRTLSGGQLSIQVEGILAIQTNAAPPLTMQDTHTPRDIFANVGTASNGAPIQLQLTVDGQSFCVLTIPIGKTVSNVVDGFALGPIQAKSLLGLDILSVTQVANTTPGSDLTLTIRL